MRYKVTAEIVFTLNTDRQSSEDASLYAQAVLTEMYGSMRDKDLADQVDLKELETKSIIVEEIR